METRNIVTFISETIGSSDTFPMIGNNVETKLVRPMPIVLLNIKEYFLCSERERNMVCDIVNNFYVGMHLQPIKGYDKENYITRENS